MPRAEVWLPIPGYPNYEASDQGNIRSLDRVVRRKDTSTPIFYKGMLLTPFIRRGRSGDGNAYRAVSVDDRNVRVGTLVLTAHVGPRPPGMVMRHLNDDSLDDRLENLAWGTPKENVADAIRNGRRGPDLVGELQPKARLREVDVLTIRAMVATGEMTQASLARQYGVCQSTVSAIVRRKRWRHL